MHEMVGIPETALGEMQPISNTSGVALSIMFQPLMNRYQQKVVQYSNGIRKLNEIILLQLYVKEPNSVLYDPSFDGGLKEGQLTQLDPADPISYESYVHFAPPLPLDKLIILNEIQGMLGLGLESKEGALRRLGEEFPGEKLEEIRSELIEEAKSDGALELLKSQLQSAITLVTGQVPGPNGPTPMNMGGGGGAPGEGGPMAGVSAPMPPVSQEIVGQLQSDLLTKAYGTKLPQRRNPDADDNNN
jgi:hypothetical protein